MLEFLLGLLLALSGAEAAVICLLLRRRKGSGGEEPQGRDAIDEGFESIMRFSVRGEDGGESYL